MNKEEVSDYLMGSNRSTRELNRRLRLPEMSEEEYKIQIAAQKLLKEKGYKLYDPGEITANLLLAIVKLVCIVLTCGFVLAWMDRPYYRRYWW